MVAWSASRSLTSAQVPELLFWTSWWHDIWCFCLGWSLRINGWQAAGSLLEGLQNRCHKAISHDRGRLSRFTKILRMHLHYVLMTLRVKLITNLGAVNVDIEKHVKILGWVPQIANSWHESKFAWKCCKTYSCEGAEMLLSAASWSRRHLLSRSFFRRSPGSSPVNSFGLVVLSMEALVRSFSVKSGRMGALAFINLRISLWISSYSSFGGIMPPVLKTWFPHSNSRWTLRTSFIIPPVPISGSSRK